MIPCIIYTIWLGPEIPDLVKACIESQKIDGYEHRLITNDNVYRGSSYVNKCLEKKEWVRAVDYLRLYYLNEYGGVYLDADCEVKPNENFDKFLDNRMFVFREESGYLNNTYIGSEANHPFLKYVLETMENNFGFEQNVFMPGMQFFCDAYFISMREDLKMAIYGESELKPILSHHGMKSWK